MNQSIALKKQKEWLKELGIDKKALAGAILKYPQLAGLSPGRVKDRWLKEFGIGQEVLAGAIVKFPQLASLSPGRVKDEWLKEFGIEKKVLADAIVKFPPLAGYSPGRVKEEWLKELGIKKKVLADTIVKFPRLPGYSPGRVKEEWLKELGIKKKVLADAIVKFPQLAGLSVKDNVKPKLDILKDMGRGPSKIMNGLITMACVNLKLARLIMTVSKSNGTAIVTAGKLANTYNRLNKKLRALTSQSAGYWIKQHKDNEILLKSVVKEILGVGPKVKEIHNRKQGLKKGA